MFYHNTSSIFWLLVLILISHSATALQHSSTSIPLSVSNDQASRNKIKPLHEADLQRLFPEATYSRVGPITEIANQISKSLSSAKKSLTSYKTLTKVLPILDWLPSYVRTGWKKSLYKDISAGVVIGIMLVPQAIAYSMVASLPAQYG